MKKLLIAALSGLLVLSMTACSSTQDKAANTKATQTESKSELNKEKTIHDINMKITSATIIKDDTLKKDEAMLQLNFAIKNDSKADYGIGSGDFYIQDKSGKKYEMAGHEDNFGDVIKSGKTLNGSGYYTIPKDAKNLTVVYDQAINKAKDKQTIRWEIGTPKSAK
ncbi:DUF4352 domain-containing protein [Listeria booriae]|uniref:DUF4352 domain-containing protein n=1 Tax=Listeria booriae TaxID=1552123 RepID=UPI0016279A83|nr:DUF4352 domain-containing protein [Listeria booriae]MBC1293265.1 DUF4352 domain-containing protein [Listeria booriae]MBC1336485.1 DUF4352 domain-containing protein [Listeria booriae]MBC6129779.1 DUF4352 domain-containing protein [Listeria booriae]MBC6164556.1 DUF4352 domain-containing protein [Listeria booriae]MBC6166075.1 DUF4352 domain-containing protein [Listeria booriae]